MRYRILGIAMVLVTSAGAQNWAPVGSGISGSDANTTWGLCTYDSVMYACGWFNNAGGVNANSIAQWNGVNWDSVGTGTDGFINAMAVYHGYLYAGGEFNNIGGIKASDIARWNGSRWDTVGAGLKGGDYGINCMTVYNGILYVGGSFDSSGHKAIYAIAQWNDTNWSQVGNGIYSTDNDDAVYAITGYNGGLYVGGDFGSTGGPNLVEWKGGAWYAVGGGVTGFVYSMAVYYGKLYVGGMLTQAGGIRVNCIASWNTSVWESPDSGIWGEKGWAIVNAIAIYNSELYVGGYFDSVNFQQINCIAKWNGSIWSSVDSGINMGGSIDAMTVFNNSLYIGGGFDTAGSVFAQNIAMYTSTSAINEISDNNEIAVFPNPNNGIFTVTFGHAVPSNSGSASQAIIEIYNMMGQKINVATLKQV